MPLEIHIAKKLREISLEASVTIGDAPVGVLGSSGAGKTMLLRCIAGLVRPDEGRIALNERVLFDASRRVQVPARQRRIGFLFQHYALFPHRTVRENISFGLADLPCQEQKTRVEEAMGRLHIDGLAERYPRELSGGEQQRVALARALVINPEALLLDEPLSALDTHLRSQTEAQLQEIFETYRKPALLVTHNIEEAYRLGEQLLVISRGKIAASGPKNEIFRRPPSMEVARLTGCKNFSRARAISNRTIEAGDWGCQLSVTDDFPLSSAHVGIRAHNIDFADSTVGGIGEEKQNTFPCWLAGSSETPFRMTLYLKLHHPPVGHEHELQAELFKEKWQSLRNKPFPWFVRLTSQALIPLPD